MEIEKRQKLTRSCDSLSSSRSNDLLPEDDRSEKGKSEMKESVSQHDLESEDKGEWFCTLDFPFFAFPFFSFSISILFSSDFDPLECLHPSLSISPFFSSSSLSSQAYSTSTNCACFTTSLARSKESKAAAMKWTRTSN